MKKINFLLAVALSVILSSCGGLDSESPIRYSSNSEVNEEDAIEIVSVSSPKVTKTDLFSGRLTCSVEFKVNKDLKKLGYGYCSLDLLDENGARIVTLHPSADVDELGEFFSSGSGNKKKFAFESRKTSQIELEMYAEQAKSVKIDNMLLRAKR